MSALAAGRSGCDVLLIDEKPEPGGYLRNTSAKIDNLNSNDWTNEILKELESYDNVTILNRTAVMGYYDYNYLTALQKVTNHLPYLSDKMPRERYWRIRAKKVILAQGAFERPLVFSGNDRPGIMLASAARTYLNQFGVLPGNQLSFSQIMTMPMEQQLTLQIKEQR
jgi:sarcosine oxidase subunit alpha